MLYNTTEIANFSEAERARFEVAFSYLEQVRNRMLLDDARYLIDGENIYANVETYQTRPLEDTRFESHEKYADIQCMLSGSEEMRVANQKCLEIAQPYDAQKDVTFYKSLDAGEKYLIKEGDFIIFFPEDAHRPCIVVNGERGTVRKMVIKVRLERESSDARKKEEQS